MRKWVLRITGVLLVLIIVQTVNTVRYQPDAANVAQIARPVVDEANLVRHVTEAVQFQTISTTGEMGQRGAAFQGFVDWLVQSYPKANAAMTRRMIGGFTPLYRWQGADAALAPVLLTAHYDVVPVVNAGAWDQAAFSGAVVDGYVWGRGTLDDKGALVSMMEAVEALAGAGYVPPRTVYFSFGHDEEIGGTQGAGNVAAYLKEQGIQLAWSLDEGSMVLKDIIGGLDKPVASINVAEKGYVNIDIIAHAEGGHSSLPPRTTAVSTLAKGLSNLQSGPVPGGLTGVSKDFFDKLGPNFPLVQRVLFANQWFYRPILEMVLSKSPPTDAMLRSTKAPTMLIGSPKENVLPQQAIATVNYRIHPRDSIEGLLQHTKDMVDNDAIEVKLHDAWGAEPSPVSSAENAAYSALETTFRQVFGDIIVVPGLTVAATDTRHYGTVADDSYRINPFVFLGTDIARLHGVNERISVENLVRAVQFYTVLIGNMGQ